MLRTRMRGLGCVAVVVAVGACRDFGGEPPIVGVAAGGSNGLGGHSVASGGLAGALSNTGGAGSIVGATPFADCRECAGAGAGAGAGGRANDLPGTEHGGIAASSAELGGQTATALSAQSSGGATHASDTATTSPAALGGASGSVGSGERGGGNARYYGGAGGTANDASASAAKADSSVAAAGGAISTAPLSCALDHLTQSSWPKHGEIQVCWDSSAMGSELEEWRSQIREWVTKEVASFSDARFRNWGPCTLPPTGRMPVGWLRIIADFAKQTSTACGYVRTDESYIVYGNDARASQTSKGTVLREFMHALGFHYESQRKDLAKDCTTVGHPARFDGYSILQYGYCWGNGFDRIAFKDTARIPRLSPSDIVWLQAECERKPPGAIVGVNDRCLELNNPNAPEEPSESLQMVLENCDGSRNQQWQWSRGSVLYAPHYAYLNALDVLHNVSEDGRMVWNYTYSGVPAQIWTFSDVHVVGMGGLCLAASGSAPFNGQRVQVETCADAANQSWFLDNLDEPDDFGGAYLHFRVGVTDGSAVSYCLQSGPPAEVVELFLAPCDSASLDQKFRILPGGRIRSYYDGCVDVLNDSIADGSEVGLGNFTNDQFAITDSQLWSIRGPIRHGSGRCLAAASDDSYENGTKVQIWTCNGSPEQQWEYWF